MKENIIQQILSTPEPSEGEWLFLRKTFVGGSEVSALFGENNWITDVQLYYKKIEDIDDEPSIPMRAGKILEGLVKELYIERTMRHGGEPPLIIDTGRRVFRYVDNDGETPVAGTFDGILIYPNNTVGVLECKTTAGFGLEKWYDGIPEMYAMQCIYYTGILKNLLERWGLFDKNQRLFAHLAYLKDNSVFDYQEIEFNEEMFKLMVEAVKTFWQRSVIARFPPTPVLYEDVKRVYSNTIKNKSIEAGPEIYSLLLKRKQLKTKIKNEEPNISKIKKELETVESSIRLFVKDAEYIVIPNSDERIASILPDKNGVRRLVVKEKLIL